MHIPPDGRIVDQRDELDIGAGGSPREQVVAIDDDAFGIDGDHLDIRGSGRGLHEDAPADRKLIRMRQRVSRNPEHKRFVIDAKRLIRVKGHLCGTTRKQVRRRHLDR